MKANLILASLLVALVLAGDPASAQVPQLINYQGRVAVGAVNFDGSGQFKFALVNADGTATYWSNDGTSVAGTEPAAAAALTVTKGLYSVLLGDATLPNMTVVPATVFTNADVRLRVWFNDGTNGSQLLTPDQRIAAVGYAMIAGNVQDGAITAAKIASGAVGTAQLGTNAVTSANIAAGAVGATQLAAGAAALNFDASTGIIATPLESPALVAAGYVKTGSMAVRAEGWTQSSTKPGPFPRQDSAAVWTGTEFVVWGGTNGQVSNEGARYNPTTGVWTPTSKVNAPSVRYGHRVVWTGTEMIVIGGLSGAEPPPTATNGTLFSRAAAGGGRYNPATDTWALIPSAPAIYEHIAVWNGSGVLILGGWGLSVFQSGVWVQLPNTSPTFYNPASDTFTPVNAPASGSVTTDDVKRVLHSGIWTGSEFLVWGGTRLAGFSKGFSFNPATNTWTRINVTAAPADAPGHTSVWTGTEMIVWGGGAGSRYNPATSTWAVMSTAGVSNGVTNHTAVWDGSRMDVVSSSGTHRYDPVANLWSTTAMPVSSSRHVAAWSGSEMLVWGGVVNQSGLTTNRLHRYTSATNSYAMEKLAPTGRRGHTAIWTGTYVMIFGGSDAAGVRGEGAAYSPASDEWEWLPASGAPSPRRDHSAIWTGTHMVVWGGHNGAARVSDGARCTSGGTWSTVNPSGAPSARSLHTAVWTGSRMLVWGGGDGTTKFADGAAWDSGLNAWTPLSATSAPTVREGHTMTWTGTEAVVWGGEGTGGGLNTGARYNPAGDSWNAITLTNAPVARTAHTAVFGNGEVIVAGGVPSAASNVPFNTGARYRPATDTWTPTAVAPFARYEHCVAWTAFDMIVWGGRDKNGYFGNGNRYTASTDVTSALPAAPDATVRGGVSSVWTGEKIILHGGGDGTTFSASTMLYTPRFDLIFYTQP